MTETGRSVSRGQSDPSHCLDPTQTQLELYTFYLQEALDRIERQEQELREARAALRIADREQARSLRTAEEKTRELESAHHETVFRLTRAAKFRDCETWSHLERISRLTGWVARQLGYDEAEALRIEEASTLHDIGKIGIPDAILRKRGPLASHEWDTMQQHTILGAELLSGSDSRLLQVAETIALSHHERWDGSGYPNGIRGDDIPRAARIVMLCDQYDALRSLRPYKPAYDHEAVRKVLLEGDGKTRPVHFDPELLDLFCDEHESFRDIWNELQDTSELQIISSRMQCA